MSPSTARRARHASTTLAVIAKAPVAGRSKTRLSPPCTPAQAAALAAAALADTLAAVARDARAPPRASCSTARPGRGSGPGLEVIAQRGAGLAERLAAAFADIGEPALVVGMDTPQITPRLLAHALELPAARRRRPGRRVPTAATGRSACAAPTTRVFAGVPMSDPRDLRRPARAPARARADDARAAGAARRRRHRRRARRRRACAAHALRALPRRAAPADAVARMTPVGHRRLRRSRSRIRRDAVCTRGPTAASSRSRSSAGWARSTAADERVLDRAQAPVLDVGCGPGRHVLALARRGHLALGVDIAPAAVRVALLRGAPAIEASVFARIPGAGTWGSALLLDGNIGIGGAPERAARAGCASCCGRTARSLVELAPPGVRRHERAHPARARRRAQPPFAWAYVGIDAIDARARTAGFARRRALAARAALVRAPRRRA